MTDVGKGHKHIKVLVFKTRGERDNQRGDHKVLKDFALIPEDIHRIAASNPHKPEFSFCAYCDERNLPLTYDQAVSYLRRRST